MMQGGPIENNIAGKAVALKEADDARASASTRERTVRDARALASGLADEGLRVVSGGTDSHLALVDVRPIGVDGKAAEALCDEVGITLNKNQIPYDPNPPSTPSGIRVGTPACSTLGMDETGDAGDRRDHRRCAPSPRTTPARKTRPAIRFAT